MHRAVIVDDERLARREMRSLLASHGEIAVVGEAETVATAAEVVRATEADVVFLDVQLEGELGFDLLPLLDPDVAIVFVTAHDRYAVRAFEAHALDYLLKPVQRERMASALARLRDGDASTRQAAAATALGYDDFLFLRLDGRMRFVKLRHLAAIEARDDHTLLRLASGEALCVRRPIGHWEERLPQQQFVRIHRSALVNVDYVERVEDWSHGTFVVHVRGSREPLRMSRRHATALRDRFG